MLRYVLRRLLISLPVLLVASFAVFALVALSGDPLANLREQPNISADVIAAREAALGLDQPLVVRYLGWLGGVLGGDLGTALDGEPVVAKLGRAFGVTMRMIVIAAVVSLLVAVLVGVISAVRQYSALDHTTTFFALLFFSMPAFFLAGVLKDLAIRFNTAVGTTVFSTVGERSPTAIEGFWATVADRAGHMALPTLTLVLITVAAWSRYQRASMLDVLRADYVRLARAKGARERVVVFRHALRNALIPLTAVVAVDFAFLINGSIVVEMVFAWNGMGRLFLDALNGGDVFVASAWLLVTTGAVTLLNLVAEFVYAALDPRIQT